MFVFRKIWHALFSWNIRFEIRSFALLTTKSGKTPCIIDADLESLTNCKILFLIQQILSWFSHLIHLLLTRLPFCSSYLVAVLPIHNFRYQTLLQHLLQCLYKYHCFYVDNEIFVFLHILVSRNHTKTHRHIWFSSFNTT